ncbi:hypothetical protein YE44_004568 [Salmonella enterica subsp. diarizonae]|nr:hypothetical protein [Salmonella enterica subsp. diarizonae]EDS4947770.1 hypothetical protein [Salmonella enterica subsp. enterica serovar Redlands]EDT4351552.1 hypothetical protein [Salmonella enterica subsp. diarizonae serovar 50:k:z]EDU1412945.1 hypothetical protein [Salmonella enterica]EDX2472794.1 hypothetical protein [Salmonella enterica subsp. diarizonae serovar 16:z10:e,n,x,z15]
MNQANIIPRSLRTHCVSVRLNNAELQLLNTKRGSTVSIPHNRAIHI